MIWPILGIKFLTSTVYTRISLNTQVSLPVDNNHADVDEDINPKEGVMLRIFRLPTFVLMTCFVTRASHVTVFRTGFRLIGHCLDLTTTITLLSHDIPKLLLHFPSLWQ